MTDNSSTWTRRVRRGLYRHFAGWHEIHSKPFTGPQLWAIWAFLIGTIVLFWQFGDDTSGDIVLLSIFGPPVMYSLTMAREYTTIGTKYAQKMMKYHTWFFMSWGLGLVALLLAANGWWILVGVLLISEGLTPMFKMMALQGEKATGA